ncbi:uncharacterized protein BKA78DRAFT_376877 [Phyllosticta capitalensis]|uniref:Uncharacterized protein n=1 Tax=Phyllosticta capitalensis TaxID=121624 RepID=A0ABR1YY43_9PEZI
MNSTTYYPPFASRGKSNFSAEAVIAIVSAVLTVLVPVAGFTVKRLFSQRSKPESVEGTGTGSPDMELGTTHSTISGRRSSLNWDPPFNGEELPGALT